MAPLARRRYQTGQLIDDGDRWVGRWREDVRLPDDTIKRVRRKEVLAAKAGTTKRMAQRLLDDRLREINAPDYRPTPLETFSGFAQRWISAVLVHDKPSTQRSDKSLIHVHLVPAFGAFHLRDISAEVLQVWIAGQVLAPKTTRNLVAVMRRMWTTAKSWGYVQTVPFVALKLPAVVKGAGTYYFTPAEALAIISAAKGWKQVFFWIMAETGMRPGELAGLRVADVGQRSIRVSQSVWQRQVQTPKSAAAVRPLPISANLAAAIARHLEDRTKDADGNPRPNPLGLVFTSETGRPLSMDNFRNRTLNPILTRLGIRAKVEAAGVRCGNYAFRHMNATVMDQLGTPMKTRQERLGHADSKTTMENYTHPVSAENVAVAEQMGALFTPRRSGESVQ